MQLMKTKNCGAAQAAPTFGGGKMKIQLVHSYFDEKHLEKVISEMKTLGAPKIKAVWCEELDRWLAVEGCHRLRAALLLGLQPVIDDITLTYQDIKLESIKDAYNQDVDTLELYEELRWNPSPVILEF